MKFEKVTKILPEQKWRFSSEKRLKLRSRFYKVM